MSEQQEKPAQQEQQTQQKQGQQLSKKDHLALGESRETWCAVELKKEQDWCRATRKHYHQQFDSSVFAPLDKLPESEPRCTFAVNAPTHRHKRHFTGLNQSHLTI